MHALGKISARAAGRYSVIAGEIVNCKVALAGINDLYLQAVRSFLEMGGEKIDLLMDVNQADAEPANDQVIAQDQECFPQTHKSHQVRIKK